MLLILFASSHFRIIGHLAERSPLHRNIDFLSPEFVDYHDAVFVVGALDETLVLRGMRYHPIDIENSVMRAHKRIAEW